MILIPYMQGMSENFKIFGNGFYTKSFQNKNITVGSLEKNETTERVKRQPQYVCIYYIYIYIYIYIIPCTCGTEYIGETIRSLGVRIREHTYNIMQRYFGRLNWLHIEYHQTDWNQTDVAELEPNTIYRKYKGATHMLCMDNPITHSSVAILPMRLPLINKELKTA
jgi:predicted GIY-YIG superfamily endonuclease